MLEGKDDGDELLVCSFVLELDCDNDDVAASDDDEELGVFARNVRATVGEDSSERLPA